MATTTTTSTKKTTSSVLADEMLKKKQQLQQQADRDAERLKDKLLETKGLTDNKAGDGAETTKHGGSPTEPSFPESLFDAERFRSFWIEYIHHRGLNQFYKSFLNQRDPSKTDFKGKEDKSDLENHLLQAAKDAATIIKRVPGIDEEFALDLTVLSLYDVAVLIDDSGSMVRPELKDRLKRVLKTIAEFIAIVSDGKRGIATVRFLNGGDTASRIKKPEDVDNLIDTHEFGGETRLGHALLKKILGEYVYKFKPGVAKVQISSFRKMRRPLMIIVITDGEENKKHQQELKTVLENTQNWAKRAPKGPGSRAVVFQFAGVGENPSASAFFRELDDQKTPVDISAVVDYQEERQGDEVHLMKILQDDDSSARGQLAKLVLGPLLARFDNQTQDISDIVSDNEEDDIDVDEDDTPYYEDDEENYED